MQGASDSGQKNRCPCPSLLGFGHKWSKPVKISVHRRGIGDLRGILGVSGKVKKGHFDGHGWT